ncbi:DciA family protein [Edaphobacter acidisoli]|nr:DciA family protein [Edaphobacter acidisoli]
MPDAFVACMERPMEGIREVLRSSLGRSLEALSEVDRLTAAWIVASGKMMAERGVVLGYADGVLRLGAVDDAWMREMMNMKERLAVELTRLAGVPVKEIRVEITRKNRR